METYFIRQQKSFTVQILKLETWYRKIMRQDNRQSFSLSEYQESDICDIGNRRSGDFRGKHDKQCLEARHLMMMTPHRNIVSIYI